MVCGESKIHYVHSQEDSMRTAEQRAADTWSREHRPNKRHYSPLITPHKLSLREQIGLAHLQRASAKQQPVIKPEPKPERRSSLWGRVKNLFFKGRAS